MAFEGVQGFLVPNRSGQQHASLEHGDIDVAVIVLAVAQQKRFHRGIGTGIIQPGSKGAVCHATAEGDDKETGEEKTDRSGHAINLSGELESEKVTKVNTPLICIGTKGVFYMQKP